MNVRPSGLFVLVLSAALLAGGCKKVPPPVVEVEGQVLLNGKPLPKALVQFAPELKDFGAEVNSTGVTDDKGNFTLTCAWKNQPGAVVGSHRVMVTDAPGEGTRGMDAASQARAAAYLASLKNRPIPDVYATYSQTPIRVTVEKGKKSYEIHLKR